MKSPIEASKRVMGYSERGLVQAHCGLCAHVQGGARDLRCGKGGFYVRLEAGCREFDARDKVAIGPTDI